MTLYYWSNPKEKQLELPFDHKGAERTASLFVLLFIWTKKIFLFWK